MTYHVGMKVPPATPRGLMFDIEIAPTWLIGRVRGGLEYKIRDDFAALGIRSFFPGRVVTRHRNGKRWDREQATVTGYLFTLVDQVPNVDAIRDRVPGFYGFTINRSQLVIVPPAKIVELRGLTAEEHALEERRREMARVKVGDTAIILQGVLAGQAVEVLNIRNGEAILSMAFGGTVKADVASLERVALPHEML